MHCEVVAGLQHEDFEREICVNKRLGACKKTPDDHVQAIIQFANSINCTKLSDFPLDKFRRGRCLPHLNRVGT